MIKPASRPIMPFVAVNCRALIGRLYETMFVSAGVVPARESFYLDGVVGVLTSSRRRGSSTLVQLDGAFILNKIK